MRSAIIETLIIGAGVGAAVLTIRALSGSAPVALQLLFVAVAGVLLGVLQLTLSRRRRRGKRVERAVAVRQPDPQPRRAPPIDDSSNTWTGLASTPLVTQDEEPGAAANEPPAQPHSDIQELREAVAGGDDRRQEQSPHVVAGLDQSPLAADQVFTSSEPRE